jgi:hypothetical protein
MCGSAWLGVVCDYVGYTSAILFEKIYFPRLGVVCDYVGQTF